MAKNRPILEPQGRGGGGGAKNAILGQKVRFWRFWQVRPGGVQFSGGKNGEKSLKMAKIDENGVPRGDPGNAYFGDFGGFGRGGRGGAYFGYFWLFWTFFGHIWSRFGASHMDVRSTGTSRRLSIRDE